MSNFATFIICTASFLQKKASKKKYTKSKFVINTNESWHLFSTRNKRRMQCSGTSNLFQLQSPNVRCSFQCVAQKKKRERERVSESVKKTKEINRAKSAREKTLTNKKKMRNESRRNFENQQRCDHFSF